jgi:hypothetical protein
VLGKWEGKRPFKKPTHRLKDNIRMHLRGMGWDVDWIHLAQDRDQW